ncbi:AAA family ATPase [Colwellia sp. BRX8-7]|uniref:AAA family ATPase n=1 Tax=Colwellia sp. BRX8-7 TaxID=2759833 RepID=UPI0015F5798F|nr:AAA family ATPase [Colwellia sp. BRX8-7]MBA6337494.1 AAA family ATPase [Colwellia sp. BRX8-7]
MINSLNVGGVATYGTAPQKIDPLAQFNFFFGANGAGKTTISRLIEDSSKYPSCSINWLGTSIQTFVYNRDFVERNFNPQDDLPGVFTLGEADQAIIDQISNEKVALDKIKQEIKAKDFILNGDENILGKVTELEQLDNEFIVKCWVTKDKYDELFQDAFQGVRNSKAKFKDRVVFEKTNNKAILKNKEDLIDKAATLFGNIPERKNTIVNLTQPEHLARIEKDEILFTKILGKSDVDIAAMIDKLGNSDWVRHGTQYLENSNGNCPFCQQTILSGFEQSLNDYFDESYIKNMDVLQSIISSYSASSNNLNYQIEQLLELGNENIDNELLKAKHETFQALLSENTLSLRSKLNEPGKSITLKDTSSIVQDIQTIINNANTSINEYNLIVLNFKKEKEQLITEIWKFILEIDLKQDLDSYMKKSVGVQKAISGLNSGILNSKKNQVIKESLIKDLEKDTTSIQPTINAINNLLKSFGFSSFSIGQSIKDRCYSIIRSDGSCAKETLSEGEKTFISFLYFYHLLKGSFSEVGITTDRIAVIDDPVSSLDSDILFIVSTLIKGLMDDSRADNTLLKQLFILTHNTYFFKEVTFNQKRSSQKLNEETFWVIRKVDGISKITEHDNNPIKSSYELLWQEIKEPARCSLTIQNTMRKILENYFTFLGNIKKDDMIDLFDGEERLVCQSLFSWVNDGSHHALDDLYVTQDANMIQTYLNVFKNIFEESEHGSHYKMMMGEAA